MRSSVPFYGHARATQPVQRPTIWPLLFRVMQASRLCAALQAIEAVSRSMRQMQILIIMRSKTLEAKPQTSDQRISFTQDFVWI